MFVIEKRHGIDMFLHRNGTYAAVNEVQKLHIRILGIAGSKKTLLINYRVVHPERVFDQDGLAVRQKLTINPRASLAVASKENFFTVRKEADPTVRRAIPLDDTGSIAVNRDKRQLGIVTGWLSKSPVTVRR